MSLLFYAWGEPKWIIVMILSTFVEYCGGILIDKYKGTKKAKISLIICVGLALSILFLFKYVDFFFETLNSVFNSNISPLSLGLPIGISFYTFQTITYSVDVYREKAPVQRNFCMLLLYVSMFPQLIAGPIVRYIDINNQIEKREITIEKASNGIIRFIYGLGKKAILANFAGQIATNFMDGSFETVSVVGAWAGLLGYTLQIYFDFSAYSDMAIGLGKMFGFDYKENFNYPYIAKSISDFWKRWHISLTTFFREYLYIPLGGNKKHHVLNLLIVWFLTGLWHGASWNFILWGLYYFVFIVLERLFLSEFLSKIPTLLSHLYTLFVVMIGWVFFYFDDISRLRSFLGILFGFGENPFLSVIDKTYITNRIFFIVFALIMVTPVKRIAKHLLNKLSEINPTLSYVSDGIVIITTLFVLFLSTACLVGESYNPFLYFRF